MDELEFKARYNTILQNLSGFNPKQLIAMEEIIYTRDPTQYHIVGLGPCLGIYLYDCSQERYMMAHTVSPFYSPQKIIEQGAGLTPPKTGHYTNLALEYMIKKMIRRGSNLENLRCKLLGGGKLYDDHLDIGKKNAQIAKLILNEYGVKLKSEDLDNTTSMAILEFRKDGTMLVRKASKKYII